MKTMNDRTQSAQPRPSSAPKRRFRIEKLEERVAPAGIRCGHYNRQTKLVGGGLC